MRGHYTAKSDNKGRVKIPAEFLDDFLALCGESRSAFVTSRDGQSVLVYPLPQWIEHEKKIESLPSTEPAVEAYTRAVNFWGRESRIDASGRLLIHPLLREAAALDGTVSVFGQRTLLELCDFERFRHQAPVVGTDDLAVLAKYGV